MSTPLFVTSAPSSLTSLSSPSLRTSTFTTTCPLINNLQSSFSISRRVRASASETPEEQHKPKTPSPYPERPKAPEQTFFGLRLRTNGDVIKFGVVAIVVPFGIKYALQAAGTPDLLAGQMTTGFVSVFALLAWISTYVFRVGTKQMTYAQQLREYEDQVIQKRYEELTEDELSALTDELKEES